MTAFGLELEAVNILVAGGGIALGLVAALWALAESRAVLAVRRDARRLIARADAAIATRQALLDRGRDPLLAWDAGGEVVYCHRDAKSLLASFLNGQGGEVLAADVAALRDRGKDFSRVMRHGNSRRYTICGYALGGTVAIRFERESEAAAQLGQLAEMLDAIPTPLWLRGRHLALQWANRPFLNVIGAVSLVEAQRERGALGPHELLSAADAQAEESVRESEHHALIGDSWRSFALTHVPLPDGKVAGAAFDMSRIAEAELRLKRRFKTQTHLLDRLKTAVAIFGPDRRLVAYNTAFVELWGLERTWLDSNPSQEVLLDHLRQARKLPERRDYQSWKRQRLLAYGNGDRLGEEIWQLPDGVTLRVSTCANPLGGTTVLYDDVTEKFSLESSIKTLLAAQSSTLDVLGDAVAAFGPDGRLTLHNAAFAEVWELDPSMLASRPHIRTVAGDCLCKYGDRAMWDRLVATVSSGPVQRRNWRKIHRDDGRVLSLTTVPLPDRATLVAFADVTAASRAELAQRERNTALATLDRLRAEYVKHLSHELRTPLNTVLGFAEYLNNRALDTEIRGSVEAIAAGAHTLRTVVDDMLTNLNSGAAFAPCESMRNDGMDEQDNPRSGLPERRKASS